MASELPPLYQLAVAPTGAWRVRVFNLPDQEPLAVPAPRSRSLRPTAVVAPPAPLPFLRDLGASPGSPARDWQRDPAGQLAVLRLAGPDAASLERLLSQLHQHGIGRVGAAGNGRVARPE